MVKIYVFEITQSISDKDKSFLLSKLDNSEKRTLPERRGKNFDFSLIGKVLVKRIISKNILIGKTKLGKPIIKVPGNLGLDISISHSGNYLVIGICDRGKIGVDIELLKNIDFRAYKNCLSVGEERYIDSGKKIKQKLENFYEIWTKKEAYLKTLGTGLQKPLPITQFYSDNSKPKDEITHDSQKYYLSTLKKDNFVLSVCATELVEYHQSYTKLTPNKLRFIIKETRYIL